MTEFVIFPNIVWKITNVSSFCKKKSPFFIFYDCKWILKFVYKESYQGNVIQINLKMSEKESACKEFNVITQYVTNSERTPFDKSMKLSTSALNEWLVWEETENNIYSTLKNCYSININNISSFFTLGYFTCIIKPRKSWQPSDVPQGQSYAEMEFSNYSPCITSMCQDIGKLYQNHLMSDVTLVCGDVKIYAHRGILAGRSPMFAAMFRNDMKESKDRIVNITELEPFVLETLVRYMYSLETPDLSPDVIQEVYAAADKYGVEALKMKCAVLMIQTTEPENIHKAAATAENNSSDSLKDVLSHFSNIKAVLSTKEWHKLAEKEPKFAHDVFLFLMSQNA